MALLGGDRRLNRMTQRFFALCRYRRGRRICARAVSLICTLILGADVAAGSVGIFLDAAPPHEVSLQAAAAGEQPSCLPSAGRSEVLAAAANARTQANIATRVRHAAPLRFIKPRVASYSSRDIHHPRILLRHRLRPAAADDVPG